LDDISKGERPVLFKDLTHRDGKSVTVNLDLVRYMTPDIGETPSTVLWFDADASITVKESIKQILTVSPSRR
jgi:hypothetical protein